MILILGILCFILLPHYGISLDEVTYIANVRYGFNYALLRHPFPGDFSYYGLSFDGLAEIVYQFLSFIQTGKLPGLISVTSPFSDLLAEVALRIPIKHALTISMALSGYLSVAGITYQITRSNLSWVSPLLLALTPPFWGHSFFNPRDIPFAGLLTFCTWFGAYFLASLQNETQTARRYLPTRNIWLIAFSFGLLIGLLAGIRIGGLAFLLFLAIAYLAILVPIKLTKYGLSQNLLLAISLLFGVAVTLYLSHPGMWFSPLSWLAECLAYHSRHGWPGEVLFEGQFIPGKYVPWYYLPRWFSITVPEVIQVGLGVGFLVTIFQYYQFNKLQKAAAILIGLQLIFLPGIAIIKGSTLYDAIRHFTFIFPAAAVFAAIGFLFLFAQSQKILGSLFAQRKKWLLTLSQFVLLTVLLFPTLIDMVSLHPYEYTYFNRMSGGLYANKDKYETDYWALSMTQVSHWLNHSLPSLKTNKMIFTSSIIPYLDGKFEVLPEAPKDPSVPFYFAGFRRGNIYKIFQQCPIVYSVNRQNVDLGFVRFCDGSQK